MSEWERQLGWTVDVTFKNSPIHGMGVFAARRIRAGTRDWEFDHSMTVYDRASMPSLDPLHLRRVLHGGYLHKPSDRFLWYADGMQFMNHAEGPYANIGLGTWPPLRDDHTVALRDIAAGEELLEDYGFWAEAGLDPGHWLYPLYLAHCPGHYAFLQSLRPLPVAA
jgi:hypothetical protein